MNAFQRCLFVLLFGLLAACQSEPEGFGEQNEPQHADYLDPYEQIEVERDAGLLAAGWRPAILDMEIEISQVIGHTQTVHTPVLTNSKISMTFELQAHSRLHGWMPPDMRVVLPPVDDQVSAIQPRTSVFEPRHHADEPETRGRVHYRYYTETEIPPQNMHRTIQEILTEGEVDEFSLAGIDVSSFGRGFDVRAMTLAFSLGGSETLRMYAGGEKLLEDTRSCCDPVRAGFYFYPLPDQSWYNRVAWDEDLAAVQSAPTNMIDILSQLMRSQEMRNDIHPGMTWRAEADSLTLEYHITGARVPTLIGGMARMVAPPNPGSFKVIVRLRAAE